MSGIVSRLQSKLVSSAYMIRSKTDVELDTDIVQNSKGPRTEPWEHQSSNIFCPIQHHQNKHIVFYQLNSF